MAQSNWEADKMLDVYIYDYLIKRNLHASAKAFMNEGKISTDPVAIDAPGGFLFEWWSVFWDIFISRSNEKHSEVAASYIETQHTKAREHQRLEMQQFQLMQQRRGQLPYRDGSHSSLNSPVSTVNSEGMLGQSTASVLAAKMYEETMKLPHAMDPDPSHLLDASRMSLLKSAAAGQPGQLVQNNPANASVALQHIQGQQQPITDIKGDIKLAVTQRPLPLDPVSLYGQGVMQSKSGLATSGLNQVPSNPPLKGWPLTGIDHLRPNLSPQMQKQFMQNPNQYQVVITPHQQQQLLAQAQAQAQGNLASPPNYGDMDPRKLKGLVRNSLNGKEGQPSGADGSTGSPIQSSSPKVRVSGQDQADYVMKMKMTQIQQSTAQQHDQLQQQHLQPNNRKRKQANSSGPANSTGTGNTVGPTVNSPPSTPSTHTPGDAVPIVGTIPHVNSFTKTQGMHGPEGTSGLASSSNQLEDLDHFGDVGSFEENVESFLTQDDGDAREQLVSFKRNTAEHMAESSKGISFSEYGCTQNSNGKVVCCHFSSDGKLLASAGHDKKAVLWKLETLETMSTKEEHNMIITDIRFRPNSNQLATSSFDGTVRLWNAAEPSYSLNTYTGHNSHVMSLDFHPKRTDLFCSCDGSGEIRYWNINQRTSTRVLKMQGGTAQIRFQPRNGLLLAAVSENLVSLFDVEADRQFLTLQGHNSEVNSVCWDATGEFLASVSQDSVRVWSLKSGDKCIHELTSSGHKFNSCTFHPTYRSLLIIGGYQTLELWNMADNKTMTMKAHDDLIAALAESPINGMVASASHDTRVKLWK